MFRKALSVLQQLKKYNLGKVERDLFEEIRVFWEKKYERSSSQVAQNAETRVIVEGFVECPASIMDKARMAKSVQEVTGEEALVLIRGLTKSSSRVVPFYRAFGINHFFLWWRNYLNPAVVLSAAFYAVRLILNVRTGDKLVAYYFRGIHVGDLMYDTLIRFRPNSYTVEKLEFRKHFRLIFRAFYTFINNEKLIKKYRPNWLITSHNVYAEFGLLARQMKDINSTVLLKDIDVYKCYGPGKNIKEHFLKISKLDLEAVVNNDTFFENSLVHLEERFLGKMNQIDVINAYRDKRGYRIEDLKVLYPDIDINNKNVFVMSHAFSDAPHVGEDLLFRDYYQFLLESLIVLNDIPDVNCFVKPHPSSYMWGEKGGVEAIVQDYSLKNINILPTDLNTNSIRYLADYIVTAKGTAGLEFSCFGIPAITAGKGYYSGFGIVLEPSSKNEYFYLLKSVSSIDPLNTYQKRLAICLLHYVSMNKYHSEVLPDSHILPGDNFQEKYFSSLQEINNNIASNKPICDNFYSVVKRDVVESWFEMCK